jgi:hypothetical protein
MKHIILYFFLQLSFQHTFGQSLEGTYQGVYNGNKMVAVMKGTESFLVGTFYEDRTIKHNLFTSVLNGDFSAQWIHQLLGELPCKGIFRNDSLLATIEVGRDKYLNISLKKISNSTDVEKALGKTFYKEKPEYDSNLLGNWKVIYKLNLSNQQKSNDVEQMQMIFLKNGEVKVIANNEFFSNKENQAVIKKTRIGWYNVGNKLFMTNTFEGLSTNLPEGEYQLKGDTLAIQYEKVKFIYLKTK